MNAVKYEHCSWYRVDKACRLISRWVKEKHPEISTIVGIQRGGLVVAVRLSHMLDDLPLQVVQVAEINEHTLLVDDIADTGVTLRLILFGCVKKPVVATIYYHKRSKICPDFYVYEKKDKWIVFPWEEQ